MSTSTTTTAAKGSERPSVVDTVIKNGFILPVKLQFQPPRRPSTEEENIHGPQPHAQTIFLAPETTVTDLKQIVRQRYGIDPQNQRLALVLCGDSDGGGSDVGDNCRGEVRRRPIFYGRFLNSTLQSASVLVEDVPVDPAWQAFYDMTGYDDWKERDQITQSMYNGRRARHCPEGYPLKVGTTRVPCVKCGFIYSSRNATARINGEWIVRRPMISEIFNEDVGIDSDDSGPAPFVLCSDCYERDTDTPVDLTTTDDPYRLILRLALEMGQRMTGLSTWLGGRGHMCGLPTASLNSNLIEFSNKNMRPKPPKPEVIPEGASTDEIAEIHRRKRFAAMGRFGIGVKMNGSEKQIVVPAGVRVVVRLEDDQRQAAIDAGHAEKLNSIEIDERRPKPLSSRDVVNFRKSIGRRENKGLWDAIRLHVQDQNPLIRDPAFDPYLKLVTYEVDQVVFELSIRITEGGDY